MLLAIEGLEGSGKTTVAGSLQAAFPGFVHTAEPTDSWYGAAARRAAADRGEETLPAFLLDVADHAAHLDRVVGPALAAGDVIVCDRYTWSRCARYAVALEGRLECPLAYTRAVHRPWSRPADLTLYLDVDPATAAARAGPDEVSDRAAVGERVASVFERLLERKPEGVVRIDATRSPEGVIDAVENAIDRALGPD